MLVIKTIKLIAGSTVDLDQISCARVGYNEYVCHTKKAPTKLPRHTRQWREDMTLPIIYKRALDFQFYPLHKFGFSPDEANLTLYASAVIQNYRRTSLKADLLNMHGLKVGQIQFQYSIMNDRMHKTEPHSEVTLVIVSMLAHFHDKIGSEGYFQLFLENDNFPTKTVSTKSGQLCISDRLTLPILSNQPLSKHLKIQVFIEDCKMGEAIIELAQIDPKCKYKRYPVLNQVNEECAILFIEMKLKWSQSNSSTQRTVTSKLEQTRSLNKLPIIKSNIQPQDNNEEKLSSSKIQENYFRKMVNNQSTKKLINSSKIMNKKNKLQYGFA